MFRFEKLDIWNDAIVYSSEIYSLTQKFPRQELFSLTDQLRRCSSSIAANIAEGSGSSSNKDFARYLEISIKSTYESVSHLQIAKEQNYISEEDRAIYYQKAEVLAKRIRAFQYSLKRS